MGGHLFIHLFCMYSIDGSWFRLLKVFVEALDAIENLDLEVRTRCSHTSEKHSHILYF